MADRIQHYCKSTTRDYLKTRCHLKFLCDDFYTYERKAKFQGGSPCCRLCADNLNEDTVHIIATCTAYSDIRVRILDTMKRACLEATPIFHVNDLFDDNMLLTQFVLDCTSSNLPRRINQECDLFSTILSLSRDLCFGIARTRLEKLKLLNP